MVGWFPDRSCTRGFHDPHNRYSGRNYRFFKMEQSGSGNADSVRWKKHFPNKGGGAYTVQWKAGGENVTPKLGFHVKD
jgi:hypothetical protein